MLQEGRGIYVTVQVEEGTWHTWKTVSISLLLEQRGETGEATGRVGVK